MAAAEEIHVVSAELAVWGSYEPRVKCDLSSVALQVDGRLVLVDPIPLNDAGLSELEQMASPAVVVCTSGNHERAANFYRNRFGIPIAAHVEAGVETEVDLPLTDGVYLLDMIEVCHLPGAAPGEIALHHPSGIVSVGDALIDLPPEGFRLLPDKYCDDPALLRLSLQKLLRWDFSVLTFAHGWPIMASARERLASLLA